MLLCAHREIHSMVAEDELAVAEFGGSELDLELEVSAHRDPTTTESFTNHVDVAKVSYNLYCIPWDFLL